MVVVVVEGELWVAVGMKVELLVRWLGGLRRGRLS